MLVLIGATEEGRKEFIGLYDGVRESKSFTSSGRMSSLDFQISN